MSESTGSDTSTVERLSVGVSDEDAEFFRSRNSQTIEVDPDALYDALETAIILGYGGSEKNRRSQVSAIPDQKLRRTRTGPNGGSVMYLGRDVIAYVQSCRAFRVAG